MNTQNDEFYMRKALLEALKAKDEDEIPVGAIIVCNDRIIARSHNMTERLKDITAHAEMQAITAAATYLGGKYLHSCTLYVTLEPCAMCAGALCWSQISRVVYGAPDPQRGYSKQEPNMLHSRTNVTKGILQNECSELIKNFFAKKR